MLQNLPEECLYLILNRIDEPMYKCYNVSLSGLTHTKLFETLRFCKKTNYNFVFVHLLKLSMVCKQFKSYFDSHKLWIELAVRDLRKGVLYKRPPKTMKHRYLQRFVYFKALHEFSVNIRALEQDHHQVDRLYKETNLDNFKPYRLSNSHCVMYRFLER
jgi:hypothetical protein